jgi:hypothetical protein
MKRRNFLKVAAAAMVVPFAFMKANPPVTEVEAFCKVGEAAKKAGAKMNLNNDVIPSIDWVLKYGPYPKPLGTIPGGKVPDKVVWGDPVEIPLHDIELMQHQVELLERYEDSVIDLKFPRHPFSSNLCSRDVIDSIFETVRLEPSVAPEFPLDFLNQGPISMSCTCKEEDDDSTQ